MQCDSVLVTMEVE